MSQQSLPLREFVLLAQREVQHVLEQLASPEARRVGPDAPAAVIASVGSLRLAVPVTFALAGPRAQRRAAPETPSGAPDAPDARTPTLRAPVLPGVLPGKAPELVVATPDTCRHDGPVGRIEIEFITCPKQYSS